MNWAFLHILSIAVFLGGYIGLYVNVNNPELLCKIAVNEKDCNILAKAQKVKCDENK